MQRNSRLVVLFIILATVFSLNAQNFERRTVLTKMVLAQLDRLHFSPEKIDDELSEKAFDLYLKRIDYARRYLTKEDVAKLERFRYTIDDELKLSTNELYETANNLLNEKIEFIQGFYNDFLAQPFDYSVSDTLELDYDKIDFCENEAELKERWRKLLKYQTIVRYIDIIDSEEIAVGDDDVEKKDVKREYFSEGNYRPEIEEKARMKIKERTERALKRFLEADEEDRFAVFLNSVLNVFDPHTTYMPPQVKEDFDINMTGKLEGIGATLSEEDGYIKVTSIVPGSASWTQGELTQEDVILKVAQGDEEPVDVVDM
ncbi:MAG: tail-specific protease, partial [Candidatus Cloacimonetes bacterium]|nr:tail-specific protease [Candidatus Cloacimonadota bacterium]